MKIIYTKHAKKKFIDLAKLGIVVEKKLIKEIIANPLHTDLETDPPKIIVSGNLNAHILRVVYKKEDDIITVITFYPTKKRRYFI